MGGHVQALLDVRVRGPETHGEFHQQQDHHARGGAGYAPGVSMGGQALTQVIGVAAVLAWSAAASVVILLLVKFTVGLRASDAHIEEGLDMAAHGERAFTP